MSNNTLIEDFYGIIKDNGLEEKNFDIESNKANPKYLEQIKVKCKSSNKEKIYEIQSGDIGWLSFENDIKSGYFS